MNIRAERAGDERSIRHVHLAAFETDVEARLVDALRRTGIERISLLAEQDDEVIGHILFSPVAIDGHANIMGLAPMAVLPGWQRQGVGKRLVNAGLHACRKAGYTAVVVLGYPDYYARFGFQPASAYGIRPVYDVPADVFMLLELREGALRGVAGTARYHPVFDEVESAGPK